MITILCKGGDEDEDKDEDLKKTLSVACQGMKMKAPIQVWTGFKNRPKDHKAQNLKRFRIFNL